MSKSRHFKERMPYIVSLSHPVIYFHYMWRGKRAVTFDLFRFAFVYLLVPSLFCLFFFFFFAENKAIVYIQRGAELKQGSENKKKNVSGKKKGSASALHQTLKHFQRTIAMEFDRKFGVIVQGSYFQVNVGRTPNWLFLEINSHALLAFG